MITVIAKDYIRTETAKGLTQYRILFRHIIKNAMLPIVNRIFLSLGSLVGVPFWLKMYFLIQV
jgi:peptide/nickel transport system permease protein